MLRRWFGLGHISDPDVPGPGSVSLGEALACLLTNRELRQRFRLDAEATATALGITSDDRQTFAALEPDALDRQADDIADSRRQRRLGAPDGANGLLAAFLSRQ